MAITAPLLWLDGQLLASSEASAPLMGHAVQRGSLVFDVGAFHETSRGPALFRVHEHVARFLRSARIVGLEIVFDEETLVRAAVRVVAECGRSEGLIRWSALLAAREPDLIPRSGKTVVSVAAQLLEDPHRQNPIRVAIFDDARKAPPAVLSPELKASGAYLGPMLARRRAIAEGADDVILLDQDGDIAEAPVANAFAVVDGVLWTPPLGRVLDGITRDSLLTIARAEGIDVREERLSLDAFMSADEAFLASTSLPIAPIGWVNGHPIGGGIAPGPITARLVACFTAAERGTDPSHEPWLTRIPRQAPCIGAARD